MKIYLTGFMGSGKTTYGKALAKVLGYEFADLDDIIEKKAGKSISALFEEEGEDDFRNIEMKALHSTEPMENTVIATGGGTPCFFDNMDWMNGQGKTIYLKLFEGELFNRLVEVADERPLLKDKSDAELQNYIYNTLRQRALWYHQSQIIIDPLNITPEALVEIMQDKRVLEGELPGGEAVPEEGEE